MKQNTINLTNNEKKFLSCVLKKGNITDTEISNKTGMSKSTVSRIRKKIEKTFIAEYIPIIDLHKVGIDVFLVLTFQWTAFSNGQLTKKTFSELKKDPHVIFLANGDGSASSTVMFIAFENLDAYHAYLKNFRFKYEKYVNRINTLLLPSKEIIKNDFTEIIKKIIEGNQNEK